MRIECDDKKLAKGLADPKRLKGQYDPAVFKAFTRKIDALKAAESLATYRKYDIRLELLKGGGARYSVHLSANWRLIFQPKEPVPQTPVGGVDEKVVKEIVLLGIVDYH